VSHRGSFVTRRGWTVRISRRDVLKGGAAATSATVLALGSGTPGFALDRVDLVGPADSGPRSGKGLLYWSTYGYENELNTIMPEDEWNANVEWVDANFKSYGYTMLCTDGWIDSTQEVNRHGYIVKHDDAWAHGWSWWADQRMVFLTLIGRMDSEVRKYGAADH